MGDKEVRNIETGLNYEHKNHHVEMRNLSYEKYFKSEIEKYKCEINYNNKAGYEFFKRTIDIVFCIAIFLPVFFLIIILSIIIRIDSPGNPIFTQIRVGKDGRLIKIHKLRSMKIDAESNGQRWAEKNDPRITRVGKIIRKFRLDELPQFFDVLIGKMSLIGPRPEIPTLTKQFNEEIPGFVTRLVVIPGLSGLAQVHGGYEITPNEKLIKDIEYIENRCLSLYLHIFFLTIKTVFTGDGAR